jgi:inosine/xanthosine triphosphate pyrophosphatase family protein
MKEIIFGTKNPAKIAQVQGVLAPLGIKIKGIEGYDKLPEIIEDGETAQENARKKAITFAMAIGKPVFSMDNALYFDELKDSLQPGIHVRRIGKNDHRHTDEELIEYYANLINNHGGKMIGRWHFAVAIAKPDGNVIEGLLVSPPRHFTSKVSPKIISGYPLESLQIDQGTGKYISEMTESELASFWQRAVGNQLHNFMASIDL